MHTKQIDCVSSCQRDLYMSETESERENEWESGREREKTESDQLVKGSLLQLRPGPEQLLNTRTARKERERARDRERQREGC